MKINIRKIFLYISMFLVLLYPFNATIFIQVYGNSVNCLISVAIGIIGLFLFSKKDLLKKESIIVVVCTLIFLLMTCMNNYYYKNGFEMKYFLYIMYFLLPFIISISSENIDSFINVCKIFFVEHISATFIGVLFKEFYKNNILAFACRESANCVAAGNYFHGYGVGVTTNYSTNAIYLSLSTIFLFSEFLVNRKKSSLFFFILSLVALFISGKRAHLLFTVLCCIILYLFNKRDSKIVNKVIVISIAGVLGIIALFAASKYIPEILNVINRFQLLMNEGDLLNGRSELYDLAFKMWDWHMLIGNGWGSFSHYYMIYAYNPNIPSYIDAHNVFIQLLCEVGILGLLFVVGIMICSLHLAFKNFDILSKCKDIKINTIICFIFAYQLFFLLYCITGNPLYDPQCYVIYFISIGFSLSLRNRFKEVKNEESGNNNIL